MPFRFEGMEFCFKLLDADHFCDALGEVWGKRGMSDGIFEETLGLGRYEADRCIWRDIERVGKGDLAGFKLLVVGHEFFCGEDEP